MNISKAVLIVVAISLALIAAWFASRRSADEKPAHNQQQGIPDDEDGKVLQQLIAAGSDLSKPHNVQFFLNFPDKERATQACATLMSEGYTGNVQVAAKQEGKWQCLAKKTMMLSHAEITAVSRRMEDLARALAGDYPGWVTQVVP